MSTAHVTYGQRNGWTMVHVSGDLDLAGVSAVRERLLRFIWEGCRHLVVDLSSLNFCDSSGFAVLVAARRHMAARHGHLRLALPAPGTQVRSALTVFGTDRVFDVYENPADAVASLAATRPAAPRQRAREARPALGAIPAQRR
ncbi:STAS domain-containing protein [Kitasatospora sp. NBC_00070]|uniref:STAS domain-containing protein n=1 Tax=Kitasatospora sp. NBC_00070 TaxID=2975962 RepID=UPI00325652C1